MLRGRAKRGDCTSMLWELGFRKACWGTAGSNEGQQSETPSRSRRLAMRWTSASTPQGHLSRQQCGLGVEDLLDVPAEGLRVLT